MTRFIVLSFAVLGWVFYEMSGGADFEPPKPPQVAEIVAETRTVPEPAAAPAPLAQTSLTKPTQPQARLPLADPVPDPALTAADPEPAQPQIDANQIAQVRTSLSQGLTLLAEPAPQQRLALVSLEDGGVGITSEPSTPDPTPNPRAGIETAPRDLREITGTRVNMRDGPGTIYPVIARLNIGQQVEILSTSGTGWLRLRTVPGNQPGWISASLVSKAAN